MAIYTTNDFSMLSAKPLDAKRIMTYNQWDADNVAGLSYPGQLYYDPETGWFRALGKDLDTDNDYIEDRIFGLSVDYIYISNDCIGVWKSAPFITMKPITYTYYTNYPSIEMQNRESDYSFTNYSSDGIVYTVIDPEQWINFYNGTMLFGNSNEIVSNTNNKVISMIGTGLTTANPETDQFIIGEYNELDEYASFIVGSGNSNNNRRNIFSISSYDNLIQINPDASICYGTPSDSCIDFSCFDQMIQIADGCYDDIRYDSSDYGFVTLNTVPINCICDRLIIKIRNIFQSSELLHIWTKSSTGSKKHIIQNYPIGKLSVGDIAIEQPIADIDNGALVYISITGGDYSDAREYGNHRYYGDWSSRANIYLHITNPYTLQY